MEAQTTKSPFYEELVRQVRALDQFGTWAKFSDRELLAKKYVKTKEELKAIPVIADIDEMMIKDIRLVFQAIALAFERATGVMCNVTMEMSHEGFGRCVVIADRIAIADKYFKDAHRFSFRTLEDLIAEGDKYVDKGIAVYNQYLPCKGV